MGQPNTRRTFLLASVASCALIATLIPLQGTAATVVSTSWVPKDPPSKYDQNAGPNVERTNEILPDICTTDTQLDCLEKVEAFIGGTWVAGTPTGRKGYGGTSEWQIPGLVNEDEKDLVEVGNSIAYNGNIVHGISIFSTSIDNFRQPWESGLTSDRCAKVGPNCVRYGNLQADVPFRASHRSSWVLPTALTTKMTGVKLTVEKLAQPGATRITVEGTPLIYMGVADEADLTRADGRGAWLSREFTAGMIDGRFYKRMKRECIEKPAMTVSDNSYGYPLPEFVDGKLDLRVSAPHFRPNGTDKHFGVYEAFIPFETAKCLWGDTITADSVFEVNILNPDTNAPKSATPSFAVSEAGFLITATDFTYSKPTIRVAPLPRPKKPSRVSVSSSRKSITTSFARVAGTKYAATATKGTVTKKLKCSSTKTRVTCSVKNLKKGTWRLSIVPTKNKVKGTVYTKRVRVK